MWLHIAGLLILGGCCRCMKPRACGTDNCQTGPPGMLHVHLIPSSFLHVAQLKTVDQTYYGTKQNIQNTGVQYVLQSVMDALLNHRNRRFTLAEVGFLWRWWSQQPDSRRLQVQRLLEEGRLEIVNGGWTVNDETVTSYQAIIDQYTLGFSKLQQMFPSGCAQPTISWQMSAHGHSSTMAALYAQFGADGMFVAHIDYIDHSSRLATKRTETMWTPSVNLGGASHIFTSILYNTHSPEGFCFDALCKNDALVDDPYSAEYNVNAKVQQFIELCEEQSKYYNTQNIAIVIGGDYHFQTAAANYLSLDKLIMRVNAKQQTGSRVQVFYSTPSCYLRAVHRANLTWMSKTDDFLPYSTDKNQFWNGLYTSRPSLKRLERMANNYLQICKQLFVLARLNARYLPILNILQERVAMVQDHNVITGTVTQAVANDFVSMLHDGLLQGQQIVTRALFKLSTEGVADDDLDVTPYSVDSCLLLNVSHCNVSEDTDAFVVTVYNPISRPVTHHVRLPVTGSTYSVFDKNGAKVVTQMIHVHPFVKEVYRQKAGRNPDILRELIFCAEDIPPLGYLSFFVVKQKEEGGNQSTILPEKTSSKSSFISNERLVVNVDPVDGHVIDMVLPLLGERIPLTQKFLTYSSSKSGTYTFQPSGEATNVTKDCVPHMQMYKGSVVEELHQVTCGWLSQSIRLYRKDNHVEFEWMVGPIPVEDGEGADVISRYVTGLYSNDIFYTDSNGRELIRRRVNRRSSWDPDTSEPIAGNYYPVSSKILIKDENTGMEFVVLTDRPQGGSSLASGQVELALHRRFATDDGMGVSEPLNEQENKTGIVIRGKHYVVVGRRDVSENNVAVQHRLLAQRVSNGPWIFLVPASNSTFQKWYDKYLMQFQGVRTSLPQNVHILSLEPWKEKAVLLRLENVLEYGDMQDLCEPTVVEIDDLFIPFIVMNLTEVTLGANAPIHDLSRLQWAYHGTCYGESPCGSEKHIPERRITLRPMQIKTFIVELS